MIPSNEFNNEGLELYFKYEHLDIETVIKLFNSINRLHAILIKTTSPVYFNEYTNERFRNFLDLTEINTGHSIKININEKWKIELPFGVGEIQGNFPKKLGIPLIISVFLFYAARQSLEIYDKNLEIRIHENEIILQENEIYQQIEARKRIEPEFRNVTREAKNTFYYILDNPDITYFELNGVIIKNGNSRRNRY